MTISKALMIIKNNLTTLKKQTSSVNWRTIIQINLKVERTKEKFKILIIKSGEKLPNLYSQNDAMLLNYVFQKIIKVSIIHYDFNPLYSDINPNS